MEIFLIIQVRVRSSEPSFLSSFSSLWWGIGYVILDGTEPTRVLQRQSKMVMPELEYEWANGTASWEPYKNCVGAMNLRQSLCLLLLPDFI